MDNFTLEVILEFLKRGLLWFIVTILFTSVELKDEVYRQAYSGVIRIPGVCYGSNFVKGYRMIGRLFPVRCWHVRADFILGYLKLVLIMVSIGGLFMILARHLG